MTETALSRKKIQNGWAMYDWANSVYNLVIGSTIFPIFYDVMTSVKNEAVKSVLDGTIISSSYTVSDGNTVLIQHPNNLVSAYKNLAVLLKQSGESVKAGEGIGWVSENANGQGQFYFEIWKNSVPVDPKTYYAN